jgi:hypothetical protein
MFDEPALLLERTIHNLEILAELFSEYVEEGRAVSGRITPTAAAFQNAHGVIVSLLPSLQAADNAWRAQIELQSRRRLGCMNCED